MEFQGLSLPDPGSALSSTPPVLHWRGRCQGDRRRPHPPTVPGCSRAKLPSASGPWFPDEPRPCMSHKEAGQSQRGPARPRGKVNPSRRLRPMGGRPPGWFVPPKPSSQGALCSLGLCCGWCGHWRRRLTFQSRWREPWDMDRPVRWQLGGPGGGGAGDLAPGVPVRFWPSGNAPAERLPTLTPAGSRLTAQCCRRPLPALGSRALGRPGSAQAANSPGACSLGPGEARRSRRAGRALEGCAGASRRLPQLGRTPQPAPRGLWGSRTPIRTCADKGRAACAPSVPRVPAGARGSTHPSWGARAGSGPGPAGRSAAPAARSARRGRP